MEGIKMPAKNAKSLQKISQLNKKIESLENFSSQKEKEVVMRLNSVEKAIERPEGFYDIRPIVFNVILFVFTTMGFTFLAIKLVSEYFDDLPIWLLSLSELLKYLCVIVFFSLAFASPITDKILKIKQKFNM
ncbi:hypothetical protein GQ568_00590 [Patescibacteria group bacterium]|nr:hypothetical protein [Patescibacteria group bacterium]